MRAFYLYIREELGKRAFDSPLFDYPEIVWGEKNYDTLLKDLHLLQKRAAKIILDKPKYSSAIETLTLLDLRPQSERRKSLLLLRCLSVWIMRVIVLLTFYWTVIFIVILLDLETIYIYRKSKLIGINKILLTKMHMNGTILLPENFRGCQSLQLLNLDYEHFSKMCISLGIALMNFRHFNVHAFNTWQDFLIRSDGRPGCEVQLEILPTFETEQKLVLKFLSCIFFRLLRLSRAFFSRTQLLPSSVKIRYGCRFIVGPALSATSIVVVVSLLLWVVRFVWKLARLRTFDNWAEAIASHMPRFGKS